MFSLLLVLPRYYCIAPLPQGFEDDLSVFALSLWRRGENCKGSSVRYMGPVQYRLRWCSRTIVEGGNGY